MRILNWNMFEVKFDGKQQSAFEKLSYALFCSIFEVQEGLLAFHNQVGIETEPVTIGKRTIGFQSKYSAPSVPLSAKKASLISSIKKAKLKNTELTELYIYLNKTFGESKQQELKNPKYIRDIEEVGKSLGLKLIWQVPSHIEYQLSLQNNYEIAQEFFPDQYDYFRHKSLTENREELLDITKTAIIQIEIEKIKESYYDSKWESRSEIIGKFHRYIDHTNETIASSIINFLESISNQTRAGMPEDIIVNIYSTILSFFPSSYESKNDQRFENGKVSIYIGYNIAYDALIHLNNLRIAEYGLTIWKYVYRHSQRNNMAELCAMVISQYNELENTLNRPERNDLEKAKLLVNIFKDDINTYSLSFPPLPDELYRYVEDSSRN